MNSTLTGETVAPVAEEVFPPLTVTDAAEIDLIEHFRALTPFPRRVVGGIVRLLAQDAPREEVADFIDGLKEHPDFARFRVFLVNLRETWDFTTTE